MKPLSEFFITFLWYVSFSPYFVCRFCLLVSRRRFYINHYFVHLRQYYAFHLKRGQLYITTRRILSSFFINFQMNCIYNFTNSSTPVSVSPCRYITVSAWSLPPCSLRTTAPPVYFLHRGSTLGKHCKLFPVKGRSYFIC